MKKTSYQATIAITRCERDFVEYIELDYEVVYEVQKLGSDFYNAFRALWLTQYLISIQELDQDYRELMMDDFSSEDWETSSNMSGIVPQGQLVNSMGLQKLKQMKKKKRRRKKEEQKRSKLTRQVSPKPAHLLPDLALSRQQTHTPSVPSKHFF
jgi:hypothetical protein